MKTQTSTSPDDECEIAVSNNCKYALYLCHIFLDYFYMLNFPFNHFHTEMNETKNLKVLLFSNIFSQ